MPSKTVIAGSALVDLLGNLESMLFHRGFRQVCGVDEAGRGPLAGPVVAAAVILPRDVEIDGLDDSKKLSPAKREDVFEQIVALAIPCAVGIVDHQAIDTMNILRASLCAMRKAVMELSPSPDMVLVDGNASIPNLVQPQFAVIGGDRRCKAIAAASVIAKVTRDRIMDRYQQLYPGFSFATHKGYPTAEHLEELRKHGPCDIHRRSFRPVAELVSQHALL